MLWALVPAKLGSAVKTRLGTVLSEDQRRALANAMLFDVLATLTSVRSLAGVAVVTRDTAVASLAARAGATHVRENHAGGLNEGVAQGMAACHARGASGVIVVMGDLPNLGASDVERTIEALPARGIVLVPSRDGTGTNVLAVRPIDVLRRTAFGDGSLARHRTATAGLETVLLPLRGAALDIDTVADLAHLVQGGATGAATRRLLAEIAPAAGPGRIA